MNKMKYGVAVPEIKSMKLPKPAGVKKEVILTIEQIFNAKSNFSVVEKLCHLTVL
jgi:hypothetical protein